eukprot:jgi/Ulvmu1/9547/UM053_0036.1
MAAQDIPGHPQGDLIGREYVGRAALSNAAVHLPRMHDLAIRQPEHAQHSMEAQLETCAVATSIIVKWDAVVVLPEGSVEAQHSMQCNEEPNSEVVALALALALRTPIRVVAARTPRYPGAQRVYTYLGLFQISKYRIRALRGQEPSDAGDQRQEHVFVLRGMHGHSHVPHATVRPEKRLRAHDASPTAGTQAASPGSNGHARGSSGGGSGRGGGGESTGGAGAGAGAHLSSGAGAPLSSAEIHVSGRGTTAAGAGGGAHDGDDDDDDDNDVVARKRRRAGKAAPAPTGRNVEIAMLDNQHLAAQPPGLQSASGPCVPGAATCSAAPTAAPDVRSTQDATATRNGVSAGGGRAARCVLREHVDGGVAQRQTPASAGGAAATGGTLAGVPVATAAHAVADDRVALEQQGCHCVVQHGAMHAAMHTAMHAAHVRPTMKTYSTPPAAHAQRAAHAGHAAPDDPGAPLTAGASCRPRLPPPRAVLETVFAFEPGLPLRPPAEICQMADPARVSAHGDPSPPANPQRAAPATAPARSASAPPAASASLNTPTALADPASRTDLCFPCAPALPGGAAAAAVLPEVANSAQQPQHTVAKAQHAMSAAAAPEHAACCAAACCAAAAEHAPTCARATSAVRLSPTGGASRAVCAAPAEAPSTPSIIPPAGSAGERVAVSLPAAPIPPVACADGMARDLASPISRAGPAGHGVHAALAQPADDVSAECPDGSLAEPSPQMKRTPARAAACAVLAGTVPPHHDVLRHASACMSRSPRAHAAEPQRDPAHAAEPQRDPAHAAEPQRDPAPKALAWAERAASHAATLAWSAAAQAEHRVTWAQNASAAAAANTYGEAMATMHAAREELDTSAAAADVVDQDEWAGLPGKFHVVSGCAQHRPSSSSPGVHLVPPDPSVDPSAIPVMAGLGMASVRAHAGTPDAWEAATSPNGHICVGAGSGACMHVAPALRAAALRVLLCK